MPWSPGRIIQSSAVARWKTCHLLAGHHFANHKRHPQVSATIHDDHFCLSKEPLGSAQTSCADASRWSQSQTSSLRHHLQAFANLNDTTISPDFNDKTIGADTSRVNPCSKPAFCPEIPSNSHTASQQKQAHPHQETGDQMRGRGSHSRQGAQRLLDILHDKAHHMALLEVGDIGTPSLLALSSGRPFRVRSSREACCSWWSQLPYVVPCKTIPSCRPPL